jgi:hypothetical protein
MTVSVDASITLTETKNKYSFVSHLSGLDLALSTLADFDNVFNATIDGTWDGRNMVKSIEFQDFFDFVWGRNMGERAAEMMLDAMSKFSETPN